MSSRKISPVADRRPPNSTIDPSGEMFGDSGLSTVSMLKRRSMLPVSTFWMINVLYFSFRTKYAMRSPTGDHDIHGTMLLRLGYAMYSNPRSISKPDVRFFMTAPSFVETRMMSSSWSRRLPVITAMRSPEGDGSIEIELVYGDFSGSGERSWP